MSTQKLLPAKETPGLKNWSGYTLDELRYRRAINHVKMEMEKERVMLSANRIISGKPSSEASSSGLFRKVFTGFSILDYALLAFQAGKQFRKIYRFFKR